MPPSFEKFPEKEGFSCRFMALHFRLVSALSRVLAREVLMFWCPLTPLSDHFIHQYWVSWHCFFAPRIIWTLNSVNVCHLSTDHSLTLLVGDIWIKYLFPCHDNKKAVTISQNGCLCCVLRVHYIVRLRRPKIQKRYRICAKRKIMLYLLMSM